MPQFFGMGKPSIGVVYDAAFGSTIDSALALGLLYGLQGKNESRVVAVTVSKSCLDAAIFTNILVRFYTGEPNPFSGLTPVGLSLSGKMAEDTPMIASVVGKPDYPRDITKMNDTADPVATIRNGLSAQYDQNALVVLAGPATNLVGLLALPEGMALAKAKVKRLVIAGGPDFDSDAAAAKKLLADWPSPIAIAPPELGAQIPFPGAAIEKDFAWSDKHPIVDAWHANHAGAYDAPATALAAALYAVRADKNYFTLNGRQLAADPAKKEEIQQAYVELASTKPVGRAPRFRPQQKKQ
jgi:hypothetical protein